MISDGPAKSFAWRRLRYLESKWNLYVLLNEYRELAEMKVCCLVPLLPWALLTTSTSQRVSHRFVVSASLESHTPLIRLLYVQGLLQRAKGVLLSCCGLSEWSLISVRVRSIRTCTTPPA